MKFKRKLTISKTTPPQKIPFLESLGGTEDEQLLEYGNGNAVLTKLIIDNDSYIPVSYRFADVGRPEVIATVAEIIGVSVTLNTLTGEVTIEVPDDCTYQINGVEIGLLVIEPVLIA